MQYPPALPDTLFYLIRKDGFSVGEASVWLNRKQLAYVDASKDGERWVVLAENRYLAAIELMEKLGWDLEDG